MTGRRSVEPQATALASMRAKVLCYTRIYMKFQNVTTGNREECLGLDPSVA
jgi:hypothetical protein